MKKAHKLSLLIYWLIYIVLIQNIDTITAGPNPVQLIHVEAHTGYSDKTNVESGYVAEPPINIDRNMHLHLEEFRNKVKELCNAYPHSIYSCLPASDNRIALTFDDGPDPHITPLVLDILEEYNTVATFFVIGENAQKYPEVVQRIVKSGHQLANHSWSHKRPTSITVYDLIDEVNKTQKVIEEKYACTKFFRPPYGLVTSEQMQQLKLDGYKVIVWSVDSMDWYTTSPQQIQKCVLDKVHPGAIILMHSAGGYHNRQATIQALPNIISELKKRGYQFVTLDQILNS
ncbi:MAG: polysaccharide deacetylase family protein [Clostridiales bacterium]|jgi:peptidoglycan/xylan/chitin deacetylase (PgdA/CDA1 family)|nr:polysaccharide deacetylase family protein [Clostridiales bacterium]